MRLKHIVWDWNGTLLNDAEASCNAANELFKKRNLGSVSIDMYKDKIVYPVINVYIEAGFDFSNESYQDVCDEYIANYLNNSHIISLHKDALAVLKQFKNKGLKQHIVSASDREILTQQIQDHGLRSYFVNILGQDNNRGDSKTLLAEKLVSLVKCEPSEMLFIGDTIHDFEVAKETGMRCCLVSNGHCSEERLKATGVPVFRNLTELFENYKDFF
ncbi:MAG TPA: HAD family hydrolase [Clostridiaceae bacterium]|jgi:phosphoglycolate phosphatase|nr:HAD family hydrolase [Clostridiaceae bacterium]